MGFSSEQFFEKRHAEYLILKFAYKMHIILSIIF